ncbi:MAG: DUF917 family protein, partial [Kutzneria sp.]|nr:DUF917 family protein [Kutzneria sp.]
MHLGGGCLHEFAHGCDVLGGGGGGPATESLPLAANAIALNGPVPVVTLAELPPDGLVMPCSLRGNPAVCVERIGTGRESIPIRHHVERHFGKPVVAMLCTQIGGYNGPAAVALAAHAGLPLLDGDAVGRSFPGFDQVAMRLAGIPPTPTVFADEHDRVVAVHLGNRDGLEPLARTIIGGFGGRAVSSGYMMTVEQAAAAVVPDSVRKALRIGEILAEPVATADAIRRLADEFGGVAIIEGRVAAVLRPTGVASDQHTRAMVQGTGRDSGRTVRLEMGHHYLAAFDGD